MTSRCGFVRILGQTNVGKSTLLNALVGEMVSIVSHKVQTTRHRILGIRILGDTQLIFVDTPGIFDARDSFDRAMVRDALIQISSGDPLVIVVSAVAGITPHTQTLISALQQASLQAILVINKIDLVPKAGLLSLSAALFDMGAFSKVFMVSALKGQGINDLLSYLCAIAPLSPHLYGDDMLTDMSMAVMASEITRRAIYYYVHQELPYAIRVHTDSYVVQGDGSVCIRQSIFVTRSNQKPIVLGRGGTRLKTIGMRSKEDLSALLGVRVHLFLTVRVRPWRDDPDVLQSLGLLPS